jgi:uncharacterized membrane protein YbhN (UPF0104 family)
MMNPKFRNILGPALSLILFAAAVLLLHKELRAYHIRDILHAFDAISGAYLWAAAGLTILSYAVMTGYDVFAMRYIRHPLAYSKIGLASFSRDCANTNKNLIPNGSRNLWPLPEIWPCLKFLPI